MPDANAVRPAGAGITEILAYAELGTIGASKIRDGAPCVQRDARNGFEPLYGDHRHSRAASTLAVAEGIASRIP
jgi:hypothetical protein